MTAAACKFRVLGGKYVLGDVLGVGGMATVYAATQPSLDRCVAVKMLRPELETNPYMVCRFRNEALAASRLSHPNVASVIDFARTDGGIYYLVMEYVRGRRLTQLLHESGPPTLQRVAVLCDQLLTAVAEVHAAGVVHGDLKADNVIVEVMRDRREFAKLIDFGLASFEGEIEAVVDQPVLAGTPEYLAPEVILGAPTSIASDLYAVGVIIYELITGATPFAGGASAEILARHVGEDVIPPSLRCAQRVVPRRLDMVVCRALAKRPEERFASATEFAQAIAEAIHGFAEPELAAGAHPESKWLATTAPTRDWGPDDAGGKPRRLAAGTAPHPKIEAGDDQAPAFASAPAGSDTLYAQKVLRSAASELERALPALVGAELRWRIKLTLATLYVELGERVRARRAARAALDHAASGGSAVGQQQARAVLDRLAQPNVS